MALGSDKTNDLMFCRFKLCHEGGNENNDKFVLEEMKQAYATIKFKPIDWEHTDKNIGVIYDAQLIVPETSDASVNELSYILCDSYVWKYKHPDEAKEIYRRYAEGTLRYSMEVYFKKAECSVCGGVFDKIEGYCDHLLTRLVDKKAFRIFREMTFGGAGVVKKPADKDATGDLVVASENKDYTILQVLAKAYHIPLEDIVKFIVNKGA